MQAEHQPFVTIMTFSYPQEAIVIRAVLESHGITCFIQDELTVQVYNFYSNAIGGVKLQVRQSDLNQAHEILREGGYLQEESPKESAFMQKMSLKLSGIPILKNVPVQFVLALLAACVITLIIVIVYLAL